jgi:hypothetical protein
LLGYRYQIYADEECGQDRNAMPFAHKRPEIMQKADVPIARCNACAEILLIPVTFLLQR